MKVAFPEKVQIVWHPNQLSRKIKLVGRRAFCNRTVDSTGEKKRFNSGAVSGFLRSWTDPYPKTRFRSGIGWNGSFDGDSTEGTSHGIRLPGQCARNYQILQNQWWARNPSQRHTTSKRTVGDPSSGVPGKKLIAQIPVRFEADRSVY
jgi:hypothetical protein